MITVECINGHVKPAGNREILWAGTSGAFFCVMYGPFNRTGLVEPLSAATILEIYYEAEFGRELFRVEQPAANIRLGQEPKTRWERITDFLKGFFNIDLKEE